MNTTVTTALDRERRPLNAKVRDYPRRTTSFVATDVRVRKLPIRSEDVLRAIREQSPEQQPQEAFATV
jgi:hypothetical protein